jgi:hypothetical protein
MKVLETYIVNDPSIGNYTTAYMVLANNGIIYHFIFRYGAMQQIQKWELDNLILNKN